MSSSSAVPPDPQVRSVLSRLHALSLSQESSLSARGAHFPGAADVPPDVDFKDQLVALDEDKATGMYLVLRAMGATRVIEAGTSYGVSLIWLLSAVLANETQKPSPISSTSLPSLVIGTENDPSKADIALSHVTEAFGSHPSCLSLLVGDVLSTLPSSLASVPDRSIDAVLLDIWASLALPVLKIVLPKLRIGGVVFVDNTGTEKSRERYRELMDFLRDEGNGFEGMTLPFDGGFDFCVYRGPQEG